MRFTRTRTLSGRGDGADQFRVRITGLAVAGDGRLFAAGDREVKSFAPDGALVERFPASDAPWSLAVDGDLLWLGMQGRIEQVDFAGIKVGAIVDRDRLGLATGIAAVDDLVLAADATHKALRLYERGRWVRDVGTEVNTRGFMIPNGVLTVAYDARRRLFVVAHPQKHRIEFYELDGEPAGRFGRFGNESPQDFGGCCNPTTCATTPAGIVLVSEKAPPVVKAFTPAGEFLAATPTEAFDPGAKNQFLAADERFVYATDSVRGTIEAFELSED
ncbi:MAG: hypothetical protein KF847_15035 [Pirellulales bacterium]|nr:hypothetical protein [Pirellulales bacterium]